MESLRARAVWVVVAQVVARVILPRIDLYKDYMRIIVAKIDRTPQQTSSCYIGDCVCWTVKTAVSAPVPIVLKTATSASFSVGHFDSLHHHCRDDTMDDTVL